MTRFARAKGSKSSNEKKPEEATSWLEMKNAMLAKKSNKQKDFVSEGKLEVNSESKKAEWASLGDDSFGDSITSIKQHLGKKENNLGKDNKKEKKKKKISNIEKEGGDKPKEEKKKKKIKISDEVNPEKKPKKRKLVEPNIESETVSPKKKKRLLQKENRSSESVENKTNEQENKKNNKNEKEDKAKKFKNSKNHLKLNGSFKSKIANKLKGKKKFKNKNIQDKNPGVEDLIINGERIQITKFQGFFITLEDAERLKKLRNEMIKQGIPKQKIESAIKLERRRAEKALSRLKKSVCFHCRGHGHLLSNCPQLTEKENTGTGICYKCGSTEHSATECKVVRGTNYQFAECFICKEQGHIARQCPDNPRGLYPQGGACRECGDVTHLRKDCPKLQAQKADDAVTVAVRNDRDLECLDEEIASREKEKPKKKVKRNSTVKF